MAQTAAQPVTSAVAPVNTFCWHELNTRDVTSVTRFYGELCGWKAQRAPMPVEYHIWTKGEHGFGGVMNINGEEWEGVPSHWMTYVRVDDVDAAASKVATLGGTVCVQPTDIPQVGRFCVANDPTGGTFSMIRLNEPTPTAQVFVWNELMTRDAGKARAFYTSLFGWTTETMEMPAGEGCEGGGTYTMFKSGETYLGGMMQMEGPQFEEVPPHWISYIGTNDVDADAAKIESLGGKIIVPPMDIPNNIGRMCVFSDAGGAHAALYQSHRESA